MPTRISKTCILENSRGDYNFSIEVTADGYVNIFEGNDDPNDTTGFFKTILESDWELIKAFVDAEYKSIKTSK